MRSIAENKIINSDCLEGLKNLPDESVDCCVTSPPYYGLRDYGMPEQIGLEETPEKYVQKLVDVFTEVKRVLKKEGSLWINLGDSYNGSGKASGQSNTATNLGVKKENRTYDVANPTKVLGLKPKDLIGIPWMVAFALRSSGWYLRQDLIWHKPNPMPESVTDRCTKSHEYIFLLSKSQRYFYDSGAISVKSDWVAGFAGNPKRALAMGREPSGNEKPGTNGITGDSSNKRSVWTVTTKPFSEAHFATFPEDLIVDMIKAGCPEGGIVLDPFGGAGTTAVVAKKLNRKYILFELNPEYIKIAEKRLYKEIGMFL